MDSFNPFANAWGDDAATSNSASASAIPPNEGLKFPNSPSTTHKHDPLGFGVSAHSHSTILTPPPVDDPNEDAWSAPVASTSAATFGHNDDEWSTSVAYGAGGAEIAARPSRQNTEDHTAWKPAGSSPVLDPEPPAWAVEGELRRAHVYRRSSPMSVNLIMLTLQTPS
jgi:hypothetical protein